MEFLREEIGKNYFKWIEMNREFLEELLACMKRECLEHEKFARKIYDLNISFSKLAILFDKFSYTLAPEEKEFLRKNENLLAKEYLKLRLPNEVKTLKLGIHNNPSLISKKDLEIINELLSWLSQMIDSFLNHEPFPQIESRIEKFKKFVEEKDGIFFENKEVKENFIKTNEELYKCAIEAKQLFENGEYYYFVLVYTEMIANFLKLVTLLSGMFLESELLSVYIDPITLLPNRFQLIKDLNVFNNCYLLIVNAKGFSKINVIYGFELGDAILKKIAAVLKRSQAIKSYRIYGDEFAILTHTKEEIEEIFELLNASVSVTLDGIKHDIYFYGAYDRFEDKALEACEFALAKNKKGLVNSEEVKNLIDSYKVELDMTYKLKKAMIKDNIIPYYQPIYVTNQTDKVLKYEVLMRVKYKDEILTPGMFMSTLIEAPFYTEFTKSVLLKSFKMFQHNQHTFSVNFTTMDIKDKNLIAFLKVLVEKYPEVAKRFTIEITEAQALAEFELLNEFISEFKKYGITFSLDDFGSGYSNFAQIAKLDIDFIKIDGSIIQEVLKNEKMQKLLDTIINFARSFNLKTIAEFVSDKEIFDYLKDKVDMMQGYYIGKPEPFLVEEEGLFN